MLRWRLGALCLFAMLFMACGSSTGEDTASQPTPALIEKTLYVAPSTELCDGESRECLLVRESNADEWEQLTDTLNGFDYTAGYTYKIQVQASPDDATNWTVVDVLSQEGSFEGAEETSAESNLQTWYLDFLVTNSIALDIDITMEFGERLIAGSGGCNQYTAGYVAEGTNTLSIEGIGATKDLCSELISQQERDYFDALSMVAEYEQADASTLIFKDAAGTPILTFVTSR